MSAITTSKRPAATVRFKQDFEDEIEQQQQQQQQQEKQREQQQQQLEVDPQKVLVNFNVHVVVLHTRSNRKSLKSLKIKKPQK